VCSAGRCAPLDAPAPDVALDAAADDSPQPDAAPDAPTCRSGFANCDGNDSSGVNGCETDITRDPGACGRCGNRCAATEDCIGGVCTLVVGPGCPNVCVRSAECSTCMAPGGSCCLNNRCRVAVFSCPN